MLTARSRRLFELTRDYSAILSLMLSPGAVAASAAVDGTPIVVREDIGRHNAVDKVVGRMLLDGRLPASGLGLFISGWASLEIVQKA